MDQLKETAMAAGWTVWAMAALALLLVGCARPGDSAGAGGLPSGALDHAVGDAIGDPTTCVVIAERAGGKILYRYGERFNCVRGLPACDRPGVLTAERALAVADTADGRGASCPTTADGTRRVGWAEGRIAGARRDLVFSAVMEGQRALPGQEMIARLTEAFANAGI
ncbi:MAG: hypothetical protein ACR2F8_09550 [Caulobacteraceae bacterium]